MVTHSEKFDIAHAQRISPGQRHMVADVAHDFIADAKRYINDIYLHLDVSIDKAHKRQIKSYTWKALVVTDQGRYYAESGGLGVTGSLKNTLDAIMHQMHTRVSKLTAART